MYCSYLAKRSNHAGETSEIKVRYDTNRVGDINKTVTVNTNIEGKQIVLSVKGKVLKLNQLTQVHLQVQKI